MNLWVSKTLRQLTVLAVALFFFSCEDETSILGFKNPNKTFKVNYVDIQLPSDVFLVDSLRSSNFYLSQGETNRLLVGKYADDQFGQVSATAITQFFTSTTTKTLLKETASFDSVSLQLAFDFYTYGSGSTAPQTISIHEVTRELKIDSLGHYFNKSNTPYNPTPLGTKTFTYSPEQFDKFVQDKVDTIITVRMPLDRDFGQRIFDSALKYRDSQTAADSSFVRIREFIKEFNGVAIVANDADKVFGFSPQATATRMTLHYHDADNDSLQLNLAFAGVVSYNEIDADRTGTPLANLNQLSQPTVPDNNLRYIQSGTGVLTRLDFGPLYEFVDADSNAAMVVNSAELFVGVPQASAALPPVKALSLRAIESNGYLEKIANREDSISISLYGGHLAITSGGMIAVALDGQSLFTVSKSGSNDYYNGFLTLFAQQLSKQEESKKRFRYFALYPESPPIGKSVNRIILQEESIKLRVYYTRAQTPAP